MGFDFTKDHIFENDTVRIVPAQTANYHLLRDIAIKETTLLRYSPSEIHKSGQLEAYFKTAWNAKEQQSRFPFLVFSKSHDRFVGSTSYGNISNFHNRLDIGWTWFGEKYQRTGINRNCKYLMLKYAFEELKFRRVGFMIDSRNEKSRNAVEKIGATFEGILRSHTIMSDGYFRDSCNYSILEHEWPEIKTTVFKGYGG